MHKFLIRAGCLLLLSLEAALGADSALPLRLSGTLAYGTNILALFEDPALPARQLLLREGQSSGRLSVIKIDPVAGKAEIYNAGMFSQLSLDQGTFTSTNPPAAPTARPTASLRLQQAGGSVLYLYQLLTGRTMIPSPSLPPFRIDLEMPAAQSEAELAGGLEKALANQGILIQAERERFALVLTAADRAKLTPDLWQLATQLHSSLKAQSPSVAGRATADAADITLPPGFISLLGADLPQVLLIYEELAGRTLLSPSPPAPGSIWLRTASALTRTEALFAFHLALALNNVSLVPAGEKFILVVPAAQKSKADALLKRSMPAHALADSQLLPARSVNLRGTGAQEVIQLYERLCGQTVSTEGQLPDLRLGWSNTTPLTPAEALYATDLLLAWHDLAVVAATGGGLKLARAGSVK